MNLLNSADLNIMTKWFDEIRQKSKIEKRAYVRLIYKSLKSTFTNHK